MSNETDVRVQVLNSIMTTPHRVIEPLIPIHNEAFERDPLFYVKLGIWNLTHGSIRDHAKIFATRIISCEFPELRAVGQKLLEKMSVREMQLSIFKVGYSHYKLRTGSKYRRLQKTVRHIMTVLEDRAKVDNGVQMLRNADTLRTLIRRFHIPVSEITACSLELNKNLKAHKKYPAFEAIKAIASGSLSEKDICLLIDKYKLPPTQVMGSVKEVTPAIAAAALKGMSPTETTIYMKMFEKQGLTKNPEFVDLVTKKVTKPKKNTGSASLRTLNAAKSLNETGGAKAMEVATDSFVSSLKKIKRKICLAIDKSGSMQEAIEKGKEVATLLAAIVENPTENLKIYVFDKTTNEIKVEGDVSYSGFESKFRYIRANGMTSLGSVIVKLEKDGFVPNTIVYITDAEESDTPLLNTALKNSTTLNGVKVVNCKVGSRTYDLKVERSVVESKGLEIENIKFDGDYYSLPNLVNVISSGGIVDTIEEIMAIDIDAFLEA